MTPKVYVGMPHAGAVEIEAVLAVMAKGYASETIEPHFHHKTGSATPAQFNECLIEFLNDPSYTHFCMIHSDILPGKLWLDILLNELHPYYDVMASAPAIKDPRGLTSTAIGSQDQWGRTRRLTVTELLDLPETFDIRHIKESLNLSAFGDKRLCLLPNTGLWLFKRGGWEAAFHGCGFRFQTRVVRHNGKWINQFVPEDWDFGRWVVRLGLKVGVTRKVYIDHAGKFYYPNYTKWGLHETDPCYDGTVDHEWIESQEGEDRARTSKNGPSSLSEAEKVSGFDW